MAAEIDPASMKLILELQIADIQASGEQIGGKTLVEECQAELKEHTGIAADRSMCQSIAQAIAQDRKILQASADGQGRRAGAAATATGSARPNAPGAGDGQPENHTDAEINALVHDELLDKLEAMYVGTKSYLDEEDNDNLYDPPKSEDRRCVACSENKPYLEVARCPCSHQYCIDCLVSLFAAANKDESLFPPRCCRKPITLDMVQIFLPADVVATFREKQIECATADKTYCHEPSCSAFINPHTAIEGDRATCPACQRTTCAVCKGAAHDGEDCPEDTKTKELLDLAQREGWQRCRSCRRLVELNTGCYHMTCLCGSQWCYICATEWKNCACAHWSEARLLDRVQAITNRRAGQRNAAAVARQMEQLMENHECEHENWRRLSGRHACEECHYQAFNFIWECRQCYLMACSRCRFNRV